MFTKGARLSVQGLEDRLCRAQLGFDVPRIIDQYDSNTARFFDLNNDAVPDIFVGATLGKLNAGDGTFGAEIQTGEAGKLLSVSDIDGDRDSDFISGFAAAFDGRGDYSWYQNDGSGKFDRVVLGNDGLNSASMAATGDVDGDGDIDLVSGISSITPHGVQFNRLRWHENLGDNTFRLHEIDNAPVDLLNGIRVGDIDTDGDLDFATNIGWYENLDGAGSFRRKEFGIDDNLMFKTIELADIDGDGDIDFSAAIRRRDLPAYFLAWFENIDGAGNFGGQQTIDGQMEASGFKVADFDDDGDLDFIASDIAEGRVSWYENYSGSGDFGREIIIVDGLNKNGFVDFADVDGDGDNDVLTGNLIDGTQQLLLVENLGPRPVGDSNNDGRFDSSDLVAVFQANEYEDTLNHNSTFDEGDWNGDGDFNSSDIVFAFQKGNYVFAVSPYHDRQDTEIIFEHQRTPKA